MGRNKKFKIVFLVFSLFGTLWANDFHSTLKVAVGQVTRTAIASDYNHIQIGYGFEASPYCADVDFQLSDKSISIATDTSYRFFDFAHFKFFARGFFCGEFLIGEKFATDTFLGVRFAIPTGRIFCFSTEVFGGLKTSNIFAIKNSLAFVNLDFACSATLAWKILNTSEIFTSLSSYELFYHPNFFAPVWTLGASHEFGGNILGKVEFAVRTIDLFTLSSYTDEFSLRLKMECKLR